MDRCSTGKRPFGAYADALEALERLDAPHLGSIYSCEWCGRYHISSRRFTMTRGKGRGKRRRKILRDVG